MNSDDWPHFDIEDIHLWIEPAYFPRLMSMRQPLSKNNEFFIDL